MKRKPKEQRLNQLLHRITPRRKAIHSDKPLILSERDCKAFFDALANPPAPHRRLIRAAKQASRNGRHPPTQNLPEERVLDELAKLAIKKIVKAIKSVSKTLKSVERSEARIRSNNRHSTGLSKDKVISRPYSVGRITVNPRICRGKPSIRDLRITVGDVLKFMASGMTEKQILKDFPDLTREDILACLSYAAERMK